MNDRIDFERLVNERFAGEHDVRPPDRAVDQILTEAGRLRPLPRWLALIKEPSMRYSSSLAVGSPTVRVLALLAATLLLVALVTAAGAGAARLLAADDFIVVDQSGGGHFTTISDAVASAVDGDTIKVRPGTYTEAVTIDKSITISGDGPVDEIVLSAPADGPKQEHKWTFVPYAVLFEETDAELSALTLRGQGSTIFVIGGAPVMFGLTFDGVMADESCDDLAAGGAITFTGRTTAALIGSTLFESDDIAIERSAPLIEGNTLDSRIYGVLGDDTIIRGNRIENPCGGGIVLRSASNLLIEGNIITNPIMEAGIEVVGGTDPEINVGFPRDAEPTIRDNVITVVSSMPGIRLEPRVGGSITGNTIETAQTSIIVGADSTADISGNTVCGGTGGITLLLPNEIDVSDNEICDVT